MVMREIISPHQPSDGVFAAAVSPSQAGGGGERLALPPASEYLHRCMVLTFPCLISPDPSHCLYHLSRRGRLFSWKASGSQFYWRLMVLGLQCIQIRTEDDPLPPGQEGVEVGGREVGVGKGVGGCALSMTTGGDTGMVGGRCGLTSPLVWGRGRSLFSEHHKQLCCSPCVEIHSF